MLLLDYIYCASVAQDTRITLLLWQLLLLRQEMRATINLWDVGLGVQTPSRNSGKQRGGAGSGSGHTTHANTQHLFVRSTNLKPFDRG